MRLSGFFKFWIFCEHDDDKKQINGMEKRTNIFIANFIRDSFGWHIQIDLEEILPAPISC